MGKGNRNRDLRTVEYVNAPAKKKKAPKAKKPMPEWLKRTISIAVVVVLVVGIVAGILASNGTFKRWQVLVKSQTGEFTVNRQVATFLAWELEYYYAYMSWYSSYYQDPTNTLFKTYPDPDSYAFDHATACVRDDLYDSNGNVISTPRDVIDDAMSLLINHVAVSDYAYEQGIRLEKDEWKGDLTITWYSGYEDTLPVTWTELQTMQYQYGFTTMDLLLDQIFGSGMKVKDVQAAMELVCMYEKYLAMKTSEVEGTVGEDIAKDEKILAYIRNNPSYFYRTDYLTYQTKDKELKDKLEAATDVENFKEIIVDNWFDKEGNYKEFFNLYVVGEYAEKDYLTLEGKTGDALKEAVDAIDGMKQEVYLKADADNTEKIPAEVSKWIFDAKREAGNSTILTAGEKFYLIVFEEKTTDAVNNTLTSITVSQKVYDYMDGDKLGSDEDFRANIWKQLLIDLELSDEEAPVVNYVKVLQKAEEFEKACEALRIAKALELLEQHKLDAVTRVEMGKGDAEDVDDEILKAVFDKDKLTIGDPVVVTGADDMTYLVFVEEYLTEEETTKATYSYTAIELAPSEDDAEEKPEDALLAKFRTDLAAEMLVLLNDVATGKVEQVKDVTLDDDDLDDKILDAVFVDGKQLPVGTVVTVENTATSMYFVCIESYDDTKGAITISYTEIKSDPYYQILDELKLELEDEVLPEEKSEKYVEIKDKDLSEENSENPTENIKEGTYKYWMFKDAKKGEGDNVTYVSPIDKNATEAFTTTKTEKGEEVTLYDVYIITEPLHLDTDEVVNGGYYVLPDSSKTNAEDALASLKGKTGDELIEALRKINSTTNSKGETTYNNATVNETIFRDDLDEKLAAWFFDDARKENDSAVVEGEDGKTYIAIYFSDNLAWEVMGKNYYVADQVNTWMAGLAAEYSVNERVLNRIGDPAPEVTTTPAVS